MSTTRQIPRDEWSSYFERFTRQHLADNLPETVTIEVVSLQGGDQFETRTARLLGVSYDPKGETFEVSTEGLEHLASQPTEIWVVEEEEEGFVSTISLTRADGAKEIFYIHRGVPPANLYEQPPA